jgi:hypothetical protein
MVFGTGREVNALSDATMLKMARKQVQIQRRFMMSAPTALFLVSDNWQGG